MERIQLQKYNRRAESCRWAYSYQDRALVAGNDRRNRRAALLIEALEAWLNQNGIHEVTADWGSD
jgi:hypothetical protein